jgi:hypothetical protein
MKEKSNMKKILFVAVISALLIVPSLSSAKSAMSDNELGAMFAQAGGIGVLTEGIEVGNAICSGNRCSFKVTFSDVYVKDQTLKFISTDGGNFWDPNHEVADHLNSFDDPAYANGHYGFDGYGEHGYAGYTEVTVKGGLVKRSGSMIIELAGPDHDPTSLNYDNIPSKSSIRVQINSLHIETGDMAITAVVKLGATPDLAGDQTLGRAYTQGVSMTNSGALTVYAHR